MRLFGEIGEEVRLELLALADVDREHLVGRAGLFEKDRDFVAVRRGPVIQVDHQCVPSVQRRSAAVIISIDRGGGHAPGYGRKCHRSAAARNIRCRNAVMPA